MPNTECTSLEKWMYRMIKSDERLEDLKKSDRHFDRLDRLVVGILDEDIDMHSQYRTLIEPENPYIRSVPVDVYDLYHLFFKLIAQKIPDLIEFKYQGTSKIYTSIEIFDLQHKQEEEDKDEEDEKEEDEGDEEQEDSLVVTKKRERERKSGNPIKFRRSPRIREQNIIKWFGDDYVL